MHTQRQLLDRLMDIVTSVELNDPNEDFAAVAFRLHALAISTLPPARRELRLQQIEDEATLRRAVGLFPDAQRRGYLQ